MNILDSDITTTNLHVTGTLLANFLVDWWYVTMYNISYSLCSSGKMGFPSLPTFHQPPHPQHIIGV